MIEELDFPSSSSLIIIFIFLIPNPTFLSSPPSLLGSDDDEVGWMASV